MFAISSRVTGQRAVLKFASYCQATPIAGRFTPGAFTNQIQRAFREPSLLIVSDPLVDHQPIVEASFANIPVIAFCNTDSPLKCVDIAIPCNTKGEQSIGLMWWFLAREVLRLRGHIPRNEEWSTAVDLFIYRNPDDVEKEEAQEAIKEIAYVPEIVEPENWDEPAAMNKILFVPADDWNDDEPTPTVGPTLSSWGGGNGF